MNQLIACLALLVMTATVEFASASDFELAQANFFEGNYPAAEKELLAVQERLGSESPSETSLYLGVIYRAQKRFDLATSYFQAALSSKPDDVGVYLELATNYAWSEQLSAALSTYEAVLARWPDNRAAWLGKARVLVWMGEQKRALPIYDAQIAADPRDPEALLGLAFLHRSRMRFGDAEELYNRVLSREPQHQEARRGLAEMKQLTRCQAAGAVGWVRSVGAPDQALFRLAAGCALNPEVNVRAGYESNAPSALVDGVGQLATARVQRGLAAVGYRFTENASAELGYGIVALEGETLHQAILRGSLKAAERWVFLAGIRPGYGNTQGADVLSDVGVQWLASERLWVMAQAFLYTAANQPTNRTGVGTLWHRPLGWLSYKLAAGAGIADVQPTQLGAAQVALAFWEHTEVALGYEILSAQAVRQAADITLTRAF